jgi:Dolichyl-phosphate-mannose-protein mannosyltransferase
MTMSMPASPTVLRAEHGEAAPLSSVARSSITAHWPLLLAIGLGVATAFFRLGTKGLWGDEVWNVFFIQPSLTQTFFHFPAPPNLPLNFLLVQLATTFSDGRFWVRLPSAVLGAATVPLLFLLGRRVFDSWTALGAALLLAVAPYHVYVMGEGAHQADSGPPFALTLPFIVALFGQLGAGTGWPFWLMATLFAIGVCVGSYRRQPFVLLALAWLALPLIVLWLAHARHLFSDRYVLFMQPIYLLIVASGLVQVARAFTRALHAVLPALATRTQPARSMVMPLTLIVSLVALTVPPTWHSYWVEKVNDWSALCAYLHRHVQQGGIVTGNYYAEGILLWCFRLNSGVHVSGPSDLDLPALLKGSPPVWYVLIQLVSPRTPSVAFVRRHFAAIPLRAWAPPGLVPDGHYGDRLIYPQGEGPATLYHFVPAHVPAQVTFPSHTQVNPFAEYMVRVGLPATAPRVLRIVWFAWRGEHVGVTVNHLRLATLTGRGRLTPFEVALPPGLRRSFLVQLHNLSSHPNLLAQVAVRYTGTHRRTDR